ncbi:MAG: sigma-54-dependent transcriptional regulator [Burkholderiales bacterium]
MIKTLPVLLVEDDQDLREALCATVQLAGYEVVAAADGRAALEVLARQPVGLVISDVQMQPMDGHALLAAVKASHPALPVVLMTAFGEVEKAVAAMRNGASDYLLKPFEPEALLDRVGKHLTRADAATDANVVACDPRSVELFELARRVAKSTVTVMLSGESGCGKEVLARFIHRHSGREKGPFVAINCAAIPEHLLEATLFGYEKGAFTGAAQSQAGKFEQAQGGTLLLDEVSEMPLALQAKLLRVLQEREVERVGGRRAIALDVRVLAASNRDLQAAVGSGSFREDLYYRLNVFPLLIPPLRERVQDIAPLAQRIVAAVAEEFGRPGLALSEAALQRLQQHWWPGNVRELENVIQRAAIVAPERVIEARHLALDAPAGAPTAEPRAEAPMDIKSLERTHILETLAAVNGSRKQAVRRLGISERTLRYKLQQYRLAGANL